MNLLREQIDELSKEMDRKHEENIGRLTRIESNQAHIDECLDDLEKKLFGNGQPGVLQLIDSRVSSLEKWLWRVTGFASALTLILNVWIMLAYKR